MPLNRKVFFDKVRHSPFSGGLTAPQVEGMDAVLTEWERRSLSDLRWLAYMLATDFHETDRTMQAIREYGRGKGKRYGTIGRNGQIPYGRGLVQLTWDDNYERADRELGLNGALVKNYDLALDLNIAVRIMFEGMVKGWFTGKKLGDYLNSKTADFVSARKIINGLDKAHMIAGYAERFLEALRAANQPGTVPPPPDVPKPTSKPASPATGARKAGGIIAAIGAAIWAVVTFINDHPVLVFLGIAAAIAGVTLWNFWRNRQP